MDQEQIERSTTELIDAVRTLFEAAAADDTGAAAQLKRVLAAMPELRLDTERPVAAEQAVCRHLARALELADAGPAAPVAAALRDLEPTLAWAQNPRYNAENRGADFMANYAYCDLGLADARIMFGVLLLGPGITYPVTSYPSEGVFLVIGGSPEWKCGDEPWVRVEPGSIIGRPAAGAEGKRPGHEPMLALYAWLYQ